MKKVLLQSICGFILGTALIQAQLPDPLIHLLLNEDAGASSIVNSGSDTSISVVPNNAAGAILTSGVEDPDRGKVWYVNSNYNGFLHVKYTQDGTTYDFPGATGGSARTYTFWVKPDGLAFSALVNSGIGPTQAFDVQTEAVGNPRVGDGTNYTKMYDMALKTQQWTHLAFVMEENGGVHEIKMYYNGRESVPWNTGTNASVNTATNGILKLFQKYKGWVSDFSYYNQALTANQVREIYGKKELLLHYKFDESSSSTYIKDYSGNTLVGDLFDNFQLGIEDVKKGTVAKFNGGTVVATGFKGILGANPRTLAVWYKQDAPAFSSLSYYGSGNDQFNIQVLDNGAVRIINSLNPSMSYAESMITFDFTVWKHIAIVTDGPDASKIQLYVDGKNIPMNFENLTRPVLFTASSGDMKILNNAAGYISEYHFYSGALTQEEIREIYDIQAPSIPLDLKVNSASPVEISLEWSASLDNNYVESYNIYRNGEIVGTSPSTNYSDIEVTVGNEYTYEVSAIDGAGNESEKSSSITVSATDNEAPSVPGSLVLISNTMTSIRIEWSSSTDNIGISGYKIYRDGIAIATTTETGYTDESVSSGATYNYGVSSMDEAGNESAISALLTVTVATNTSVGENSAFKTISLLYPSITEGEIFFHTPVINLKIYNITGKLVKQFDNYPRVSINLSDIETGIYFIQIDNNKIEKIIRK